MLDTKCSGTDIYRKSIRVQLASTSKSNSRSKKKGKPATAENQLPVGAIIVESA